MLVFPLLAFLYMYLLHIMILLLRTNCLCHMLLASFSLIYLYYSSWTDVFYAEIVCRDDLKTDTIINILLYQSSWTNVFYAEIVCKDDLKTDTISKNITLYLYIYYYYFLFLPEVFYGSSIPILHWGLLTILPPPYPIHLGLG